MAMTAESSLPTPILVAEVFVTVIVRFGEDWAAIGRLPAMVGAVSLFGFRLLVVIVALEFRSSGAGII